MLLRHLPPYLLQITLSEVTSSTTTLKPLKRLKGHTSSVLIVAASPSGDEVCSGPWDASIKLWSLRDEPEDEEDVGGKKRKSETGALSSIEKQVNARATLQGHTQTCSKALHCPSVGGEGHALLAAGGADRVLRIWDPRLPGTVSPVSQLSSHTSWISACKWHPKSTFHILTTSYDKYFQALGHPSNNTFSDLDAAQREGSRCGLVEGRQHR